MTGSNTSQISDGARALWKKPLLRAALIIAAALIAYLPATHGGYIWDDDVYVTENPLLSAPDGLRRIWFSLDSPSQYFPLVYTTFRIEHAIWGLNPAGYHWVNIVLHIANALLVWWLLSRLKIPGAWLAAMVFGLHPVHVESVAWITERKNVLSVFFFLLTLLAWTRFIAEEARKKWAFYALALVCSALALFAKTTACTLPAALLLILWLKHMPINRWRIAQVIPFLALGAGMGGLTIWWERFHQGTHGKLFALGLADRVLIATHAVWFYLGKILWPVNLAFSYPHWTLHPWNPLSYSWLLACLALCYVIYCAREDIGRGGEVAALYFVATLSPMLGFIMLYTFLYSFVADHYQYAASIGPIALVCAGVVTLAQSCKKIRNGVYAGSSVLLLALGFLTWKQCHIYESGKTIWSDTLRKNPGSLMAHFNLANQLMREGNYKEGLLHYDRAVEIDPTFVDARVNRADSLIVMGRPEDAEADYMAALKLDPGNDIAQNRFGTLLRKMNNPGDAAIHFQKAVELQPHYPLYRKNLADTLASLGDFSGALPNYLEIERLYPDQPQSHLELGPVWLGLGKPDETIREYSEAIRLDPRSAEAATKLAWVLATCGNPDFRNSTQAIELAQRACELTHQENAVALNTLAAAYAADGRFSDAVTTSLSALEIAERAGDKALAGTIRQQMELYQNGRAYFQPAPQ